MKADLGAQGRLLDLQAIDTAIARLDHQRGTLPETATARSLQVDRVRASEQVIAAGTVVSDADLELKKAEHDLVPVRERLDRDETRVADGSITAPKALQSLLDEIAHLKRRINELEDAQLEAMQRLEDARAVADAAQLGKQQIESELRSVLEARQIRLSELAQERETLGQKRHAIAAVLPDDLLKLYSRIAERCGGVGAAKLQHGRCGGCHLEANSMDMNMYKTAASDEVLRCEECSRILVRTADSGL